MDQEAALKNIIRGRIFARAERERQQGKLLPEEDDFHEVIRSKLDGLLDSRQFWNFSRCGHEEIFRTCKCCGATESFKYRCNIKWCPRCQWRITDTRRKVLQCWTQKISQPKHLVLTQKNFPIMTRHRIRTMTRNLAAMRRRKSFSKVRGGCVSVEITNEGSGWHLHSHWLLDCNWLSMPEVASDWASLVGQEFAIVKVKDVRGKEYLQEVSKYVVEGSEMAKWPRELVLEFVTAVRGLRFFFAFGSLHALGPVIRAEIKAQKPPPPVCECGSSDFDYEDEPTALVHEIALLNRRRRS